VNNSLIATLWPQSRTQIVNQVILVALGVALLAASSKVQVPLWPIPMTLQTLVVLLIGSTYGFRLGIATIIAYLAIGTLGVPVFARGGGLFYMVGPTGGYLAGYLLAVAVMGWLGDRGYGKTLASTATMFLAGEAIIFVLGTGWYAALVAMSSDRMAWLKDSVLYAGFIQFIPAELLKMGIAAGILSRAWKKAEAK
jgi:biotin transport system substrate-specific component